MCVGIYMTYLITYGCETIAYLKHSLIKQHGILSELESYGIINLKLFQIILEYYKHYKFWNKILWKICLSFKFFN